MSPPVKTKGSKGATALMNKFSGNEPSKGHQARAKAATGRMDSNMKKYGHNLVLDRKQALNETDISNGLYPVSRDLYGQWYKPSPYDEDARIRTELTSSGKNPSTPFGVLTAGSEVVDYMKGKKEQEQYAQQLALASKLIDPIRPETQEHAYQVAPELKDYPEKAHRDYLALCESLRTMLISGRVGGPDDNALISVICRDDFDLPIFPSWDPEGILVGTVLSKLAPGKTAPEFLAALGVPNSNSGIAVWKGIFNPTNWAVGYDGAKESKMLVQKELKKMILYRLYPGFRTKKILGKGNDKDEVESFIAGLNAIQGGKISNNSTMIGSMDWTPWSQ